MALPLTTSAVWPPLQQQQSRCWAVQAAVKQREGSVNQRDKDNSVVFVAGSTGRLGSRTVRELLKLGLQVRGGARSLDKFQSVFGEQATTNGLPRVFPPGRVFTFQPGRVFTFQPGRVFTFLGPKKQEQPPLQFVQLDLEKAVDDIEQALENSGVVICVIGASESRVFDVTGPYRIDYQATKNLIDAAKSAQVNHFVLVTSLGTTKFGFPAAVLNLFWGVLIWKERAERALINSGLTYTIVRPGGMERPTDSFKETHNLRLGSKDTFTGGQVSRLQVGELLACIAKKPVLAQNQVVEAIAETTAPISSIEDLLAGLPQDNEEVSGTKEAKDPSPEKSKEGDMRTKYEDELMACKQDEQLALTKAEALREKRIEIADKAEAAAAAASRARALADALAEAARNGRRLSEDEKRRILVGNVNKEDRKQLKRPVFKTRQSAATNPAKEIGRRLEASSQEKRRSFRWFWEEEDRPPKKDSITKDEPNSTGVILEGQQQQTQPPASTGVAQPIPSNQEAGSSPAVLSPYKRYGDMKPPPSPSPPVPNQDAGSSPYTRSSSPAAPEKETPETEAAEIDSRTGYAASVRERETIALAKARAASFVWPWRKREN